MLARMKKEKTLEEWQLRDAQALRRLFDTRTEKTAEGKPISQMEFGAKHGIGSQGMVWQYLNGRRPLNIKAAVSFARGLGVKVSDISETLASQIEDAAQVDSDSVNLKLVKSDAPPQLQWVTEQEAKLLAEFRACGPAEKLQSLVFVESLPKTLKRGAIRDNA